MCNEKVYCSFSAYDCLIEHFKNMEFRAGDYVPGEADMLYYVNPSHGMYVDFLLWIIETGVETEENRAMRKRINDYLRNVLELVDEEGEEAEAGERS